MAKLFVQMSVSLDGFIEDPDGGMDWFAGDEVFDELLTSTLRGIDGMIFGRKAHGLGAAYWPTAGETAETAEVADQIDLMNSLPKYVLTHGKEETGWANSHAIGTGDIPRLKSEAKRPIALFAGARAAQLALDSGHVDELRLIRYPVVLGGGTPLFAADGQRRALTLVETQSYVGGPTVSRYAVGQNART
jgi:dihydrofolate reductase